MKVKIIDLINLQAWCQAIPPCKALGFRSDIAITRLGLKVKEQIEYEGIAEFVENRNLEINRIKNEVLGSEFSQASVEQISEINRVAAADTGYKEVTDELFKFCDKEVDFEHEAVSLSIPDDCADKLTKTEFELYGLAFNFSTYSALIDMITRGYIKEQ